MGRGKRVVVQGAAGALALVWLAAAGPVSASSASTYYVGHQTTDLDVQHYGLSLRWNPRTRVLDARAAVRVRPLAGAEESDSLELFLSPALAVRSVEVDGQRASYSRHGSALVVSSAARVVAGAVRTVVVRYDGTPQSVRESSRRDDVPRAGWITARDGSAYAFEEPVGAYTWFPCNDTPRDKARYDLTLDVPAAFTGVSGGRLVRDVRRGRRHLTSFHLAHPVATYLVPLAVGRYSHARMVGPHGLPVNVWYPVGRKSYLGPLRALPATLRFLESRLGPYPFESAGAVIVPNDSAEETQTMVSLGSGIYAGGASAVQETMAHELAHQWYGDSVTPAAWEDVWMNEGMAMYVQSLYSEHRGWVSPAAWSRRFEEYDARLRAAYGPPGDYHPRDFAELDVYYCPALMWTRLAAKVGPSVMASVLRDWPHEHADTSQTREAYLDWLAAKTGVPQSWFTDYLTSTTTPPAS